MSEQYIEYMKKRSKETGSIIFVTYMVLPSGGVTIKPHQMKEGEGLDAAFERTKKFMQLSLKGRVARGELSEFEK